MPTPVPPEVLAGARAAADSLIRYAAGDTRVTDEEALAYRNLIHALKLSGVRSPVMELIDRAAAARNAHAVPFPAEAAFELGSGRRETSQRATGLLRHGCC